jgi:hypothetical protein
MNTMPEFWIVVLIILATIGIVFFLFPWLSKRGHNVEPVIDAIGTGIESIDKMTDAALIIAPDLPFLKQLDSIIALCQTGYKYAEDLCNAGKIGKGEEKEKAATEIIIGAIKDLNLDIEITPEVESLISSLLRITATASHVLEK